MKYPTIVKTLLVTEAVAGEEIGVRSEDTIVVLRPLQSKESRTTLSPREALRKLQSEARLSHTEAENYLASRR